MSAILVLVIAILTMLIGLLIRSIERIKRPKGFPPGPTPLPIIGNLHQLGFQLNQNLCKLGKKYGGIFGIDYGSYRSVVVNDLKIMKQFLSDPAFSGRPKFRLFLERGGVGSTYARGIAGSESQHWVEQRRFAVKNLRDFGFGKSSMEGIIQEEIKEFVKTLRKNVGKPIKTRGLFNAAVVNSLWRICTGCRTPQNDPEFQKVFDDVFASIQQYAFFFPFLAKLLPNLSGYNEAKNALSLLNKYIKAEFEAHKITLTPGKPRDLMDTMIEQIAITSDPASSFYQQEGKTNVIISLADLFIAGSETTSTTLTWIFLIIALFADVQEKVSQEIQRVIGPLRLPQLNDRPKMAFTECTIMEVMRYVAILPLGFKHSTIEETKICGYTIPKDTVVTPNLYAVFHDKEIWGDPDVFRPERFLLPDGTANKNHEAFIPFSVGKRICIAEKLAKDELFLFTTSLLQQFRITTNPSKQRPSLKAKQATILTPQPHELVLHERL